jgi:glycosyltransferase involved in cell wall biosynthesis
VVMGWGLGAPGGKGLQKKIREIANRNLLRHFDAIITYSRRGAEEYRALGAEPGRIFIAPNAAEPRPTWPIPPRPEQFQNGQGVVLFVGRLQARKRVGNLLRACALLPSGLQPKVWIVGDGPERPSLEELAADVYPETEFFGPKRGLELRPFFERADLLVLPGTGGLAIQQGMAFGLPVLAGEADGTQEDLVRPENGWQLKEASLEALTAGLETALSNPLRLRQMGRESFRIVENEINLENMVDAFKQAVQFFQER